MMSIFQWVMLAVFMLAAGLALYESNWFAACGWFCAGVNWLTIRIQERIMEVKDQIADLRVEAVRKGVDIG